LGFWFYLYIRTFNNALLCCFLVGNSQELGIATGKYLELGFWFI
jgi:hypothetical protein